jgi:TolA-binding protein
VWPDPRVQELVEEEFVPVRVHVQKQPDEYQRLGQKYGAEWTPTILMLDPTGNERHRVEGFLPTSEFVPHLAFGAARIAFSSGEFENAENRFRHVADAYPEAEVAPEALYWAGVSRYKGTGDAGALRETSTAIRKKYPASSWAKKASVWEGG